MARAKALIAGPHTYTFILLRNLLLQRPSEEAVLLAYLAGVLVMYIVHMFLVWYKKTNSTVLQIESKLSTDPYKKTVSCNLFKTIVHEYAANVTNSAYLAITTVQLLHVTAIRETFLVTFVLVTLRVQQTLSGGKRAALFSGPLGMLVVTILCVAALFSKDHKLNLSAAPSPYANTENGLTSEAVVFLCVLVGASAQAHLQWIVFHEHNDTIYAWNTSLVAFMTFLSHIVLACVSGYVAAYHPIMIDVFMVLDKSQVGLLVFRLTLTILLLLLCTAPINDNSVMKSMLIDGSIITCTVLIIQAHPVVGSFSVITVAVCMSLLAFVFVYTRPDEWSFIRKLFTKIVQRTV
jgi:hypothetical protein